MIIRQIEVTTTIPQRFAYSQELYNLQDTSKRLTCIPINRLGIKPKTRIGQANKPISP